MRKVFDIAKGEIVVETAINVSDQDFILPEVIGGSVARKLVESQVPPAPATAPAPPRPLTP